MNSENYQAIASRVFPGADLLNVERLQGGVSAEALRFDLGSANGDINRFVLRLHGAHYSGHTAALEHRLLQVLHESGVPVPRPLFVDANGSLVGDPFVMIEFNDGTSSIPAKQADHHINQMAEALAAIHDLPTLELPALPLRTDPLAELHQFLPRGHKWARLTAYLDSREDTEYLGEPHLLHGDFWPGNLIWKDQSIAAILDWEDAALGDPLSDVACTQLELRYKFGKQSMADLANCYARHRAIEPDRLALWQIYVAGAAQRFMGNWGLEPELEAHMRSEALNTIQEAGDKLMA